ncbi:COP9 signalosome complex subunit 7b-like, partial [Leptonychotes weddellii]|uniref:COP9 signalosome complex subunit 7b-like n=1 Tax=Leptonychotes weddellii TaxID=9713 RepID=A0A2U3Z7D1_LEPWE
VLCYIFRNTGLGRSEGQEPSLADRVLKEVPIGCWGQRFWRPEESSQAFLWLRAGYLRCRCDGCEAVLLGIEQQVLRANQYKENHSRTQQQVEAEVTNIKKTLKATAASSAQEMEQQLAERECPPHAEQRQPTKKMSKVKGLVSSRH